MWEEKKIGDFAELITKGTTPTSVGCKFEDTGINYIKSESIGAGRQLDKSKYTFISDKTHEKLKRSQILEGDILFSMAGAYLGKTGIVREDDVPANTNQAVAIIRLNPERVNPEFVYYVLNQPRMVAFINSSSSQSAQPNINLKDIGNIAFGCPNREIQDKIVSLLSDFDRKIEINEEINRNLKEQADAIYKSMFISNVDSDWSLGKLSDLINVKYGKDHKKLEDGMIPVYGSGGIMRYVDSSLYENESVLIPRKGSLQNVMYVNEPFWSVDTMFYSEMKMPNIAKFIFHFLCNQDLAGMNAGSAVPSMTTAILNAIVIRIPSEKVLEEFEGIVSPMYIKIQDNNRQSEKLMSLRDTLLPKLMTGDLDVSDLDI